MVNLLNLLLPNWNFGVILTSIAIVLAGVFLLWLSKFISFNIAWQNFVRKIGLIGVVGGLAYWLIISFFDDLVKIMLANNTNIAITIGIGILILFGIILFGPKKKESKQRKKITGA